MLTMHIVLDEQCADQSFVVRRVKQALIAEFAINHSTIEVEFGACADH
jgi:Co/Zn/Cd efflux system component